jgi:hypothetical protein
MLTIAALVLFAAPQGPVLSRLARPLPGSSSVLVEERVLDAATGRVLRRASVDGAPVDADATLRDALADLHRRNGKLHPSLVAQFAAAHGDKEFLDPVMWYGFDRGKSIDAVSEQVRKRIKETAVGLSEAAAEQVANALTREQLTKWLRENQSQAVERRKKAPEG